MKYFLRSDKKTSSKPIPQKWSWWSEFPIWTPCHRWGPSLLRGNFQSVLAFGHQDFSGLEVPSVGEWGKKRLMSEYPHHPPPLSLWISQWAPLGPPVPRAGPRPKLWNPPLNLRCEARREDLIWAVRGANTEPGRRSASLIWSLPTSQHPIVSL